MNPIPAEWLPPCSMKRVVIHWTAGAYAASELDRRHYHLLVQGDGTIVRGLYSIDDNVSTSDGKYAAHTRNCNTGSIGISMCCMAGTTERPFNPGACPMKEAQWDTAARAVAQLCRFYQIPVTPKTVLAHGEIELNLGIKQLGKWDPLLLPWRTGLSKTEVAQAFRGLVEKYLEGREEFDETFTVSIMFRGSKRGTATVTNGGDLVRAQEAAQLLGWQISSSGADVVVFRHEGKDVTFPAMQVEDEWYIDSSAIAETLGLKLRWDADQRTVYVD